MKADNHEQKDFETTKKKKIVRKQIIILLGKKTIKKIKAKNI